MSCLAYNSPNLFRIRESQIKYEEATKAKEIARDALMSADRRAHANQNALEESRTLLEQVDRNRRILEQELADTNETLGKINQIY